MTTTTANDRLKNIPWIEKYRPKEFDKIVLDETNRQILENILTTGYFPNLFLYGPPGTGKTTTIINLINAFQTRAAGQQPDHTRIIHLNASDDRGIDVIRGQINNFVNTKGLYSNSGLKFVILDEVDYMTKGAQHAFRYLLMSHAVNVRFCLICNYISKIDEGLQNHFMKLRFNQLPATRIYPLLREIVQSEAVAMTDEQVQAIQAFYKSDIRSMINFIQNSASGGHCGGSSSSSSKPVGQQKPVKKIKRRDIFALENPQIVQVINDTVWEDLFAINCNKACLSRLDYIVEKIYRISLRYNLDVKSVIKLYVYYIIRHKDVGLMRLSVIGKMMHSDGDMDVDVYMRYILTNIVS